jgi:hypothetical protein
VTSNIDDKTKANEAVLKLMAKGERKFGAEVMDITPAIAQVMLDMNPNNRSLKTAKIDQYAQDMQAGRFRGDNGETIIFSKDGLLNDGQNRLSAIVRSGLAQRMLVAFGVGRDTRFTVDLGTARTAADSLNIMGNKYGGVVAAAARRILAFRNSSSFHQTGRISTTEAIKFGSEDEKLQEIGSWAHNAQKQFRPFKVASSELATLYYLFNEQAPKGQAKQFFNLFGMGMNLTEKSPILALRNKLLKGGLNHASRAELIVKAWNAWIRDEETTTFQVNGKIPDIKGPKRGSPTA